MMTDLTAMTKLSYELLTLSQKRATGELQVNYNDDTLQCRLYFYSGRLVYATGGLHPVRRWYRGIQKHCPNCFTSPWLKTVRSQQDLWEIDLINQAMAQDLISLNEAKAAIRQITQEVLFEVIEHRHVRMQWNPGVKIDHQTTFLPVEQSLMDAQLLRSQWYATGMGSEAFFAQVSPNLTPVILNPDQLLSHVSPATFATLTQLMQGRYTLWDVAMKMRCTLPSLMRMLWKLIQQGVIELRSVPDFAAPVVAVPKLPKPVTKPKKNILIACIDDSAAIGKTMTDILEPEGYDVLTITNPLQGISILLERKPQLIFLDLVMPNTNGYELCTFLRKTSTFQDTPIVILTGHDGVIDRVRAKLAGSSDFVAKPPEADKVLQVLERFLEVKSMAPENTFLSSAPA